MPGERFDLSTRTAEKCLRKISSALCWVVGRRDDVRKRGPQPRTTSEQMEANETMLCPRVVEGAT